MQKVAKHSVCALCYLLAKQPLIFISESGFVFLLLITGNFLAGTPTEIQSKSNPEPAVPHSVQSMSAKTADPIVPLNAIAPPSYHDYSPAFYPQFNPNQDLQFDSSFNTIPRPDCHSQSLTPYSGTMVGQVSSYSSSFPHVRYPQEVFPEYPSGSFPQGFGENSQTPYRGHTFTDAWQPCAYDHAKGFYCNPRQQEEYYRKQGLKQILPLFIETG